MKADLDFTLPESREPAPPPPRLDMVHYLEWVEFNLRLLRERDPSGPPLRSEPVSEVFVLD